MYVCTYFVFGGERRSNLTLTNTKNRRFCFKNSLEVIKIDVLNYDTLIKQLEHKNKGTIIVPREYLKT
jgi:hypothetical protein